MKRILLSSLLFAPLAVLHAAEPPAAPSGTTSGQKWKLVFNDEFDGNEIDMMRWKIEPQRPWAIPGFQTKHSDENCALDGHGNLVLRLTRNEDGIISFNRGLRSRTFEKAFGFFETRVQFSTQPGWWTSVYLGGSVSQSLIYGRDTFRYSQEFDIFEDFYKPKTKNDISHCYHANTYMGTLADQGNAKGLAGNTMLARAEVGRVAAGKMAFLQNYGGWHTVGFEWSPLGHVFYVDGQETLRQTYKEVPMTTVPQQIAVVGCFNVPRKPKQEGGEMPFYGWLEEAKFPDQVLVDYVRIYDQDHGDKTAPRVTVSLDWNPNDLRPGKPATFRVHAEDKDGPIQTLYLFSRGQCGELPRGDASALQRPRRTSFPPRFWENGVMLGELHPCMRISPSTVSRPNSG